MEQVDTSRSLRFRYILTICAGSFLLFLVQPMVARMALPRLGGAPTVWNSAMLVYQALLLGGYAYAHWLGRFAPRRQATIHLVLFLAAALMLPIGLIAGTPSASANPFLWVPWLFIASIGPLFFMVAAQAPLMQRWFSASGGGDPYPLYAASNLGSFAGLITYPLIVEPLLPLKGQSMLWSIGYGMLVVLIGICAVALPKTSAAERQAPASAPPSARTIGMWMLLAAIPSGLMLSTSTHLTTDIVAMPLLWVVPLGLYLLSFFGCLFGQTRTGECDHVGDADHPACGRRNGLCQQCEVPVRLCGNRPYPALFGLGRAACQSLRSSPRAGAADGILSRHVGWGGSGRTVLRADCAAGFRLGL